MNSRTGSIIAVLLSMAAAANGAVKSISVGAGGVLCLSCAYRVEKAIQRVAGVEKVKVGMQPVCAVVTPRGGAWIEADRLREAIRNAGFRPGDIRYTVTGQLTEWRGQPALRVGGSDRIVVLQPAPKSPEVFAAAQQALAGAGNAAVEVEGEFVGRAVANDSAAPVALRACRLEIARQP